MSGGRRPGAGAPSTTRARVLLAFRSEPLTAAEVAARFSITMTNAYQVLSRLVARGEIERIGIGEYRRAAVSP